MVRVKWQVDDGYVGKSRPQYTSIPDERLKDLTPEERDELIEDYVQGDFDERIGWVIDDIEEA